MIRDVAQFGSALGSGPRGRWFKSSRPDQTGIGRTTTFALYIIRHGFVLVFK